MKKQEQNTKETVSMLVYGYLMILFAGLPLYMQNMEVVDNASDENNENTRRKATVVPIKIEYV